MNPDNDERQVLDLLRQCAPCMPDERLRQRILAAEARPRRSLEDRLLALSFAALVLSFAASAWMEHAAARRMAAVAVRAQAENTTRELPAPQPLSVGLFALRRSLPLPMGATSPYVSAHELLSTTTLRNLNDA